MSKIYFTNSINVAYLSGIKLSSPGVYDFVSLDKDKTIVKETNVSGLEKTGKTFCFYQDLLNPNDMYITPWYHFFDSNEEIVSKMNHKGEKAIIGLDPIWIYSPDYSPKRKNWFISEAEIFEIYNLIYSPYYDQDEIDKRKKDYIARTRKPRLL